MAWQPINTAPELTPVLVWHGAYQGGVVVAIYRPDWHSWSTIPGHYTIRRPTVWQPLPDPPVAS